MYICQVPRRKSSKISLIATNIPTAAAAIMASVIHKNVFDSAPLRCSPMIRAFDEMAIMSAISGTADDAVEDGGHDERLDGVYADEIDGEADERRGGDDAIEAVRLLELAVQAFVPVERFGERVRGAAGEHRHGEQAEADDAGGEDQLGKKPAFGKLCTSGASAFAASAAVATFVTPPPCNTVAPTMMMHHVTKFEINIPKKVSKRMFLMNDFVTGFFASAACSYWSTSRSSSTSSDACQKNIYGEIVVPATPTRINRNAKLNWMCGKNVACRIAPHGSCTKNTVTG